MAVKILCKIACLVAGLAATQPTAGYAGRLAFEEGEGAIKRLLMAILTARVILLVILEVALFIVSAVYAGIQDLFHRRVSEILFARRLGQVALNGAVHLLGRIMRDLFDVPMAVHAHDALVRPLHKQVFVDVEESEATILVNPAQAAEFVAQHTVQFIFSLSRRRPCQTTKHDDD